MKLLGQYGKRSYQNYRGIDQMTIKKYIKKYVAKNAKKYTALLMAIVLILCITGCTKVAAAKSQGMSTEVTTKQVAVNQVGQIYLYGEMHGVAAILDKEFELWKGYYDTQKMRHLFVELPYYTAEFLNVWMQSDNDDMLNELFGDAAGTQGASEVNKMFYQRIKKECPETIFHGTDVGHQYDTTGVRYLTYLEDQKLESSEQFTFAKEAIEQGKAFYAKRDFVYREKIMTENFKREFDQLETESVMGIYGSAHTGLDQLDSTKSFPCMANQLNKIYIENMHSEDLSSFVLLQDPIRVDSIEVAGKTYQASYFGEQDRSGFKDYEAFEFWRLEDAYVDFKDIVKGENVLPYDNYPMRIEAGQVFVIDLKKTDGSVQRVYYRSDGDEWEGRPTTVGFQIK